jgi:hypothetical protein
VVRFPILLVAVLREHCAPGPRLAIARRYRFSPGAQRSKRTRKKFSSNLRMMPGVARSTSFFVIGLRSAKFHNS